MAEIPGADNRRHPRIEVQESKDLLVHVDGKPLGATLWDISEGGVGITIARSADVSPDDTMAIGQEQIVNLRARVRWVRPDQDHPTKTRIGVQFESVIVQPKRADDVQEMVDAWMHISESYSTFDSFLRILDLIDNDILDGKLTYFPDAVGAITLWMENSLGGLNLWHVIEDENGSPEVQMLVELNTSHGETYEVRRDRVTTVASAKITRWYDRVPYIYGEAVVIEFFGESEGKIDLLHKLGAMLGKRVRMWTKLINKNIALDALSDELQRRGAS